MSGWNNDRQACSKPLHADFMWTVSSTQQVSVINVPCEWVSVTIQALGYWQQLHVSTTTMASQWAQHTQHSANLQVHADSGRIGCFEHQETADLLGFPVYRGTKKMQIAAGMLWKGLVNKRGQGNWYNQAGRTVQGWKTGLYNTGLVCVCTVTFTTVRNHLFKENNLLLMLKMRKMYDEKMLEKNDISYYHKYYNNSHYWGEEWHILWSSAVMPLHTLF